MKLKNLAMALTATALLSSTVSFAGDSCNLTKEKIENKLKSIIGNAEILQTSKSPINNLYEVIIEVAGKKVPIYVDCSLRYLITGEIIDIELKKSITKETVMKLKEKDIKENSRKLEAILGKEKFEKIKPVIGDLSTVQIVDLKNIPSKGVVVYGNKDAKVKIFVITDPQCPFCKRFHNSLKTFLKDEKDAAFYIVMFPLSFHRYAQKLSEAIVCQKDNKKAKELLDEIFENQDDTKKLKEIAEEHRCDEGKEIVETHKAFAKSVKLGGTPTLVFDLGNGKGLKVSGAFPPEKLKQIVDALK